MTDEQSKQALSGQQQLGAMFKQAREQRKLEVSDVAAELKVLISAVKGLESGNYAAIKGRVFVKGYIKIYAQFLQLDVAECLALYTDGGAEPEDNSPTLMAAASEQAYGPKLALVVIAVVVVLAIVYGLVGGDEPNDSPAVVPAPVAAAVDDEIADSNAAAQAMLPSDLPLTLVELPDGDDGSVDTAETDSDDSTQAHTLAISFSADCWVEVNDADGNKLISDLKREGEKISLHGQPPYEVLLGYGPAATIEYQGAPVSFKVGRNPTVKLSIGTQE